MDALRSEGGAGRGGSSGGARASRARLRGGDAAEAGVAQVVTLLKAIGHPLRFRIVSLLCDGERNVGAIARRLGARPPIVSQQLRILRAEEIVTATRAGKFARYRLGSGALRALVRSAEVFSGAPAARARSRGRSA